MTARIEKGGEATDAIVLRHDERRVRRKRLVSQGGIEIMLNEPRAVTLEAGDRLVTDAGTVEVIAADEDLTEVRGHDAVHLLILAWQIGNRHLPAQIAGDRIIVLRDGVIGDMLKGLGATLRNVRGPFQPVGGAYDGTHSHGRVHHDPHD
ncbi:urease accessory protein UreE [Jannaschia sp. S6380]|uniref:urease accessory protein UreE n=1 Tax=Jannaschia sp. S6380 TaxID=2926408 RepID=UPI001FF2E1DD|nr:urease accessory protein UreE [Jannaschia sp. S6380]MCK0167348.1 urease accessory protein UreE [Jannaschia sp. S6380]